MIQVPNQLREQYSFEEWSRRKASEENIFIWKFFLSGNELPGWEADRIQTVQLPDWPPFIRSIWRSSMEASEVLLSVGVFECASREVAHEFLLHQLGEFQSPLVERHVRSEIGDVAFAGPEDTVLLFARGNLVVLIRNAGRQIMPVTEIAERFDSLLVTKPEPEAGKIVPKIHRFDLSDEEPAVRVSVPLAAEAADPAGRPVWYQFFSEAGEVLLEKGRLAYRPSSAGPQRIRLLVLNAERGATSRELEFVVGGS